MRRSLTRRTALRTAALSATAAVAGCIGSGVTPPSADPGNGSGDAADPDALDESLETWLANANGYAGYVRRVPADGSPRVRVGSSANEDDPLQFQYPGIRVAPGTTVTWVWTGHGGSNNVVATGGSFDSGDPVDRHGATFEHTFESVGTYQYASEPHGEDGMRGAVLVREPPETGYPAVDEWLKNTAHWQGHVVDETGRDAATVTVGTRGDGPTFAFGPSVLKISRGTTVSWKWSGDGPHTVTFRDGSIPGTEVHNEPGVHYEHTFDATGVYQYFCAPHRSIGMKGAVVVE
ncbi:halocyanin domain-containing protein [Halobium salinum]|uniref:Halocyanin domain-containing protein n=1 Tax=Halobium salinum TaxID=1364940 RepID=A0ABD5PB04_9EURY|nr:halocyanin domain-containing protein [Halobium salinum]